MNWVVTALTPEGKLVWTGIWPSDQMRERQVKIEEQKTTLSYDRDVMLNLSWEVQNDDCA